MVAVMASLSGCGPFWGGGWFWSELDPEQKANISFEGTCDDSTGDAVTSLTLTFHDRGFTGTGVYGQNRNGKKHMAIGSVDGGSFPVTDSTCAEANEDWNNPDLGAFPYAALGTGGAGMLGMYCPLGYMGEPDDSQYCGEINFYVIDMEEGGASKGDLVMLQLIDGYYDGYTFGYDSLIGEWVGAELQGGNFTVSF